MSGRATPTGLESGTRAATLVGVALLLAASACTDGTAGGVERPAAEVDLLRSMLIAEDARASTPEAMAPLHEGLSSENPELRRFAVRALGRFEREALVPTISPLLSDPDPGVRAEAANALAQAVLRADAEAAARVRGTLLERLGSETDLAVRGKLAQSIGRTRHASASDVEATATALAQVVAAHGSGGGLARLGVVKGLYFLARQPAARGGAFSEGAAEQLRVLAAAGPDDEVDARSAQRARTLAMAALAASGRVTAADLEHALADEDPLVRREGAVAAATVGGPATVRDLLTRAMQDASAMVRYEGVRGWGRVARDGDCEPIARAARDPDGHVALLAIDLLAGCSEFPGAAQLLDSLAAGGPGSVGSWHRAAHALVALASLDPARARERLAPFVQSDDFFVRTYAASAAAALGDTGKLRTLAADPHPNVRVAALGPLAEREGRAADPLLIQQLGESNPQLAMTVAELLEGTTDPNALPALLDALDRFTARRRETERDARAALLDRIDDLGSSAHAERLRPHLADYDPVIAGRAAEILSRWTGTPQRAAPEPLPAQPVPHPAQLDSLEGLIFTVEMADGGSFQIRLRAWDAPTNAYRFARLAEAGYFDGLTYHRVAPNFVVQGGSPGANEYAGDGPYTRDELGADGHWRGTVGLSTRGRDTGDGQMFINHVDNVRLDHEYTVFGEVVSGMEVVDRILEGARILRIRQTSGPRPR